MDGRDERFAQWMDQHLTVLARISRAFAPPADQPDLLQDLMLAVWKAAPSFRGDSSVATFIHRVAHNRAISWRRRESLRLWRTGVVQAEWARLITPAEDPVQTDQLGRLYAAIRRLRPLDRSLVVLSLEGMGQRQIGELHGMTESAVGVRLMRARKALAADIAEDRDGL